MEKVFCPAVENGDEIREVGGDVWSSRIEENEGVVREVVKEEIMGALKKMKRGKASDIDGIVAEMLNNLSISIIDWLMIIFNNCIESGVG